MATKRMLVDASHPEETRIVVTSGNRLDEFDFESANRRQLRGNIYLAKVTRVEPSLQAAFVDYGGNRHGFLAFSEIHPDYYQIPVADREALLRAEAEANAVSSAKIAEIEDKEDRKGNQSASSVQDVSEEETQTLISNDDADEFAPENLDVSDDTPSEDDTSDTDDTLVGDEAAGDEEAADADETNTDEASQPEVSAEPSADIEVAASGEENFEDLGGGEGEDLLEQRRKLIRRYKIQEVIKRRQVLLVQVVKEERGNKGAALTTYLSLAGRYSVLMPNTARGGGISRKITSAADRKRLKQIAGELTVPAGMGVILRTAGASRTKAEIRRDFEYLSRLWENVRELTMKSAAPSLVYEEGSLIKRTIRDLYNKEIGEVLVAGDAAYREAKDFMRLIMPSHAKSVQAYKEDQHLFTRYNVESQLDSMFSPQVTLPSGGYLVINPTEALVSIDVNSGRATKEHNIEATAQQTNLEAADEVARQLRLRDLAGLIVIDFIDMTERRSIRNVEKRMKDALKNDRARIQVGRISHFGLLEMSRQRMRFGVLESSTAACPTCEGTGIVRSVESSAIMVMRAIEDHVVRRAGQSVEVRMTSDVALYILNAKRALLIDLEQRLNLIITISADHAMTGSQFSIDKSAARPIQTAVPQAAVSMENNQIEESDSDKDADESQSVNAEQPARKRRRRKSNNAQKPASTPSAENAETVEADTQNVAAVAVDGDGEQEDQPRKRRRRGRRGGRRNRRGPGTETDMVQMENGATSETSPDVLGQTAAPAANGVVETHQAEVATSTDMPISDASGSVEASPEAEQNTAASNQDAASEQNLSEGPKDQSEDQPKPKKPARRRSRKSSATKGKSQERGSSQEQGSSQGSDQGAEISGPPLADAAKSPLKNTPTSETLVSETPVSETPVSAASVSAASVSAAPTPEAPKQEASSRKDSKPAKRAVKPMAKEGVIVSTSSDQEVKKPKRRGWWSLK